MKKTILIAAVMFCALSVPAFAQIAGASFTASSEQPTVACCGLAERTGNITFQAVLGSQPTVTGTITVTYPLPITNLPATTPAGTGVEVVSDPVGVATLVPNTATNPNPTNDPVTGAGTVLIAIAAGVNPAVTPITITLRNVRLDVSSLCGTGPITASLASVNNTLTVGETNVVPVAFRVSQALQDPFLTLSVGGSPVASGVSVDAATGAITAPLVPTVPVDGQILLNIREGFPDAFGLPQDPQAPPTPAQGSNVGRMIRLRLAGSLPAGVTLTFPGAAGNFTRATSGGVAAATDLTLTGPINFATAAGSRDVFYEVTTATNPTATEAFIIPITVGTVAANLPLVPGTVTLSAHIAPITDQTSLVPRYSDSASCETEPVQILSIAGAATTSLLVPFATFDGTFDTGITVANTTLDPGAANMGITTAAIQQTGTITYYFFPQSDANGTPGAVFSYTTKTGDDDLGGGLETDGSLAPGGSHIVLLSQLLTAAGKASDVHFAGYMIIVTRFTNGHGQYFISDFETFSNGGIMLVIDTNRTGTEGLEQ